MKFPNYLFLVLFAAVFQFSSKAQSILSASPLTCVRGDTLILNITASGPIANPYALNLVITGNTEKPFSAYNTTGNNYELTYYVKEYAVIGNYTLTNGTSITYGTPIAITSQNFPEQFSYQSVNNLSIGITTGGGSWADENGVRKIVIDNAGNKYIVGTYTGTSTLGSFTFLNAGNKDAFVAKIGPTGTVRWVKTLNGTSNEGFYSLKLYNDTVLYVCGFVTGGPTLKYNGVNLTEYSLRNAGTKDGILMKLDTAGLLVNYAFQGSKKVDYTTDMDIDSAGNVYLTGSLQGDQFGSSPNDTCATYVYSSQLADSVRLKAYSNDSYGLIIAKYNPQLQVQWAKRQDRDYFAYGGEGRCIRLTNSNQIVVLAWTQGPVSWGGTNSSGASCCNYHYCLLKTDINGLKIWAKESGNFSETTTFGLDAMNNVYLPSTSGSSTDNTSLEKYSPAGTVLWKVRVNNNPAVSSEFYITTDASGNSYMTYAYQNAWATSGWNIIFKKFDSNGEPKAIGFPQPYVINDNGPTAIALNPAEDKLFVAGNYIGSQNFGGTVLTGSTIKPFFIGMSVIPASMTGIPYSELSSDLLNLYPNPVAEQITVDLTLKESQEIKLQVFNALGQSSGIVRNVEGLPGQNKILVDVADLPAGIYFTQIVLKENMTITKRFVVSK